MLCRGRGGMWECCWLLCDYFWPFWWTQGWACLISASNSKLVTLPSRLSRQPDRAATRMGRVVCLIPLRDRKVVLTTQPETKKFLEQAAQILSMKSLFPKCSLSSPTQGLLWRHCTPLQLAACSGLATSPIRFKPRQLRAGSWAVASLRFWKSNASDFKCFGLLESGWSSSKVFTRSKQTSFWSVHRTKEIHQRLECSSFHVITFDLGVTMKQNNQIKPEASTLQLLESHEEVHKLFSFFFCLDEVCLPRGTLTSAPLTAMEAGLDTSEKLQSCPACKSIVEAALVAICWNYTFFILEMLDDHFDLWNSGSNAMRTAIMGSCVSSMLRSVAQKMENFGMPSFSSSKALGRVGFLQNTTTWQMRQVWQVILGHGRFCKPILGS